MKLLDHDIKVVDAKCKFILDIIESRLVIQKRTKSDIVQQLKNRGYPLINKSYEYLLRLPIYTLSKEEIDKLLKEKNNLMEERTDVSETTPEEMWKRELSAFKMVYKKLFW